MPAAPPSSSIKSRGFSRRLVAFAAVVVVGVITYWLLRHQGLSLESLVRHRAMIDGFIAEHRAAAIVTYVCIYIVTVAVSVPGATILTVIGGLLFGVLAGGSAAVVGATAGASLIFLFARTALGEPLLRRAGPRALQLAQGFRDDAFSYLLFLRLVPAFPFFLVNLVPALAGVRLGPFVAATALGVIPASFVYALAGTGLDSVMAAQGYAYRACLAAGRTDCRFAFNASDVLTWQLIGALAALGVLALVPVAVKRVRARARA
jgi:uncharacterized membrane protein YdjX (TVP38/TMEM64 family)